LTQTTDNPCSTHASSVRLLPTCLANGPLQQAKHPGITQPSCVTDNCKLAATFIVVWCLISFCACPSPLQPHMTSNSPFSCTTNCLCLKYDNGSLYHSDHIVRIGMTAKAWQRVKEDTAWMWPLIKFLLGSASFMVWWAALRHWLPHMCSSRKQFWRTLRSVCAHTQYFLYAVKRHKTARIAKYFGSGSALDTVSMLVQCSVCAPAASLQHFCWPILLRQSNTGRKASSQ